MKVKTMVILDSQGMKEKTRTPGAIKLVLQEFHPVDPHLHHHIMPQSRKILVREEGQILRIQKTAIPEMNLKEIADEVVVNQEVVVVTLSPSMFPSAIVTMITVSPKILTMV